MSVVLLLAVRWERHAVEWGDISDSSGIILGCQLLCVASL